MGGCFLISTDLELALDSLEVGCHDGHHSVLGVADAYAHAQCHPPPPSIRTDLKMQIPTWPTSLLNTKTLYLTLAVVRQLKCARNPKASGKF